MKLHFLIVFLLFLSVKLVLAQTNSVTSGNWNDVNIWSTGVVPINTTNANVNHPVTINQDITISTGDYTLSSNVTDLPGGTAYNLSVGGLGLFDVYGYVVFEGTASSTGGGANFASITVRNGGTLVLGATSINNKSTILVEAGGTLIINGNLTIDDNQGSFTISGTLQVNGNISIPQGNIQIDGTGDVFTTGTIFSTGSSTIFGSTGDCDTGPCSGRNLCATFDNVIDDDQIMCSSSTPALLTNTDNSGVSAGAVYSWEQSTTSSSSGFSTVSSATTATYQPPALTQTTWYRRVIVDAACTGTSAPVKITVLAAGGWRGTTSDWNTASNWCSNSVPTNITDVEITSGVPFQPTINAASSCRNLLINLGATVTISGSNTLDIKGNLTNNGTLTVNSSTVSFTGNTTQTIGGTSINIFNNLVINNTSGLTPAISMSGINNVGVDNTLTMTAGLIDLNGYNFTVGSSATSPGTLNYTAGRFYDGNLMRWFNTTAKTVGDVTGLFPVGTATDYRPLFAGHTALSTGGTIRVSHTGILGSINASFTDDIAVNKISNSFWSVAAANGLNVAGNAFSLRAEGTGFGTIQEVTDLRLTQASSAPGAPGTNAGTILNPQVNRITMPLTAINNDVYYLASVDGVNTTLPVELLGFWATIENDEVMLHWETDSELNNAFFNVERSGTGESFTTFGEKVEGHGTTNQNHTYSLLDTNPIIGTSYYRLKQTDFDGTFSYSKIIPLTYEGPASAFMRVYPNPTKGNYITIEVAGVKNLEALPVVIYDQLGKEWSRHILKVNQNSGTAGIELVFDRQLPKGIYMIKTGSAQIKVNKFVVYDK